MNDIVVHIWVPRRCATGAEERSNRGVISLGLEEGGDFCEGFWAFPKPGYKNNGWGHGWSLAREAWLQAVERMGSRKVHSISADFVLYV